MDLIFPALVVSRCVTLIVFCNPVFIFTDCVVVGLFLLYCRPTPLLHISRLYSVGIKLVAVTLFNPLIVTDILFLPVFSSVTLLVQTVLSHVLKS